MKKSIRKYSYSRFVGSLAPPLVCSFRVAVPIFVTLLFFGAMVWAKSDDPFVRKWFRVKTASQGKVECVAVFPKPLRPCPVVVYLHDAGGTLMTDGKALRQLAELGMVTVSLEYDQTNYAAFEEQFTAVLENVRQQKSGEGGDRLKPGLQTLEASNNPVGWVGDGVGAQNALRYLLKHPEARPNVLVQLGSGWVPELEKFNHKEHIERDFKSEHSKFQMSALLVHGERDEVVSVEECRKTAQALSKWVADARGLTSVRPKSQSLLTSTATNLGMESVTVNILPGLGHSFEPDRALVIREVGEYVKAHLTPEHPHPEFTKPRTIPFLICALPSFLWVGLCLWMGKRKVEPRNTLNTRTGTEREGKEFCSFLSPFRVVCVFRGQSSFWEVVLRVVAIILAVLALAQTAWHLVPPRLEVSERTLSIARRSLLAPKWHDDFEALACWPLVKDQPIWKGQKLKTLLTHVELAHYCVYELINWKLPPEIYRDYVLCPVIEGSETEMDWRRPLWEFYYPRIRKENTTEAAAEIVVQTLRERVTIWPGFDRPQGIDTIWKEQITGERGFELIYVATLRSVGVPARLDSTHKAEFWDGEKWRPAPHSPAQLLESNFGYIK